MRTTFTLNGAAHTAEAPDETLLTEYLRDTLGLTGTHIGCDTSQCGACNVLVDGESAKACTLLVATLEGARVTTIEGLGTEAHLHPMQAAFRQAHGLQCGFCTTGMVMSSIDLLQHHPQASEAEIRELLEGNICRCTGYQNIVKAVQQAQKALA